MQQLSELRYAWASVQHQRETLQGLYNAHAELVKTLSNNAMRYSPAFHLEDFFDRYSNIGGPGGQSISFDAANVSLSDVFVDFTADAYTGHDLYAPRMNGGAFDATDRLSLKRKLTSPTTRKRADFKPPPPIRNTMNPPQTPGLPTPHSRGSFSHQGSTMHPPPSPMIATPNSLPPHPEGPEHVSSHMSGMDQMNETAAGFGVPNGSPSVNTVASTPFGQPYLYNGQGNTAAGVDDASGAYDPMFGSLPTNPFGSPAAWHGDEGIGKDGARGDGLAVSSPGAKSNNGSVGTGPSEEKDPFLSLLEQLAENEQRQLGDAGQGGDVDFFFGGTGTST
jgi:hypothetical protein